MARYFHVITVQSEGRKLGRWSAADRAAAPANPPEIPAGSRLVAVVNNGEWQSAIDVSHASFFERVHRRYMDGVWQEMALYLIDETRAAKIEDGRRFLMSGLPVRDPGPARHAGG